MYPSPPCINDSVSSKAVKERNSNFELLRLFSMFLIVSQHLLLTNTTTQEAFYVVVHIAVPCFVLISGYFGIKFSIKGLLNLFIKCAGYTVSLYLAYCIVRHKSISIYVLIQSFVGFYPRYWFIGTYLGLYLISPIINIPLKTATKEQKIGYITILGLISFWLGWAGGQHTMADGKNITNLIFLYYIGNFLHYNIDHNKIQSGKWRLLLVYIVLNAGLIVTFLFTGKFELFQKILFKVFFPYNSPGVIMNAILCFLLFSTIKIQSSKINWAASSVLSIYLIHRGLLMGFLRKSVVYIKEITSGFLPVLGLFILAICIACIIIDKLIEPIQKHIGKMMYNRMGLCKIDDILKTISDGKICQKYY